ncbi:MAG: class I SAM-dependent methyltransferase [Methylacidiphilales bacterium]|nr:class I SAM-dependent methyltransferase [Candidatus Methylacidiphilales bacterium]
MRNDDAYAEIAVYYRKLAGGRDHFSKQFMLIKELLRRFNQTENPKILDAACGTGDVLKMLLNEAKVDATGVDGSHKMMEIALNDPNINKDNLHAPCQWQEFSSFGVKKFDFVFILGHALPHLEPIDIPAVFTQIYNILTPNGVFCFDMRFWERDSQNRLYETGRPAEIWRWLGEFEQAGERLALEDFCSYCYTKGKQHVNYRIKRMAPEPRAVISRSTLEYSLFDQHDVQTWLSSTKFGHNVELIYPKVLDWKYLVVVARKQGNS